MKPIGLTLLLWFVLLPIGRAEDVMDVEIDYVLNAVVTSDCVFIRNGKEHGPAAAKDHLNLKRRRGKRYFSSADEFIENLASSSSWSGKPYHIQCGSEPRVTAKEWFTALLEQHRQGKQE